MRSNLVSPSCHEPDLNERKIAYLAHRSCDSLYLPASAVTCIQNLYGIGVLILDKPAFYVDFLFEMPIHDGHIELVDLILTNHLT